MFDTFEDCILSTWSELETRIFKEENKFTDDTRHLIQNVAKLERKKNKTVTGKMELGEIRKLVWKNITRDGRIKEKKRILEILETNLSTKQVNKHLSSGLKWNPKLNDTGKIEYGRRNI